MVPGTRDGFRLAQDRIVLLESAQPEVALGLAVVHYLGGHVQSCQEHHRAICEDRDNGDLFMRERLCLRGLGFCRLTERKADQDAFDKHCRLASALDKAGTGPNWYRLCTLEPVP